MNFRRLFTLCILALLMLPAVAGGKKKTSGISFHIETDAGENPKMVAPQFVAGKERYFRRMPDIATQDIAAFNPFPSQDGDGFGVIFQLKGRGKNRLAALTVANTGRWLLARVNGRAIDAVLINRQITDGEIVIWKGISLAEVQEFDKSFPRLGQKKPRG